jgi:phosphopantetheinyl transferase
VTRRALGGALSARPASRVSAFASPPRPRVDRRELVAGCEVWLLDLTASDGEYARARGLLSDGERARADAIRGEPPRRRFVLARAGVRVRLGEALGLAPERVVLRVSAHGKPELAAAQVAPRDGAYRQPGMAASQVASRDGAYCRPGIAASQVASRDGAYRQPGIAPPPFNAEVGSTRVTHSLPRFNLTHGDGVALLAIHPRQDIGIDIERIAPPDERPWRRLLERICHPSELHEAIAEARELGPRAFYERWVGKEAVLKALGLGLRISPAAVPLQRDLDGALRVGGLPVRPGLASGGEIEAVGGISGASCCRLTAVRTPPGFVGAVALVERAS